MENRKAIENRKILPPIYFLGYALLAFLLNAFIPVKEILPFPITLFGYVLVAAGFLLNGWTSSQFLKSKTTINPYGKSTFLIKKGPFRFSRNPIYLAFFIILFGIGFVLGSVTSLLPSFAFILTMNKTFIVYEEADLEKTFGKKYISYKQKVRRWI